jgi:hypothetical protein
MIFLTACARVGSDGPRSACPPVVEYSRAEQAQVAEEVAALPESALIPEWLADYAVLREQARTCETHTPLRVHLLNFDAVILADKGIFFGIPCDNVITCRAYTICTIARAA